MPKSASNNNGATLAFEDTLWTAADKLRGHLDAADYKHVVLGLIFLKYISDAFTEHYEQLKLWTADAKSEYYVKEPKARYEVLEDRDEYTAQNVFWVPKQARWTYLQANAKQPTIGQLVDDAMVAIEDANPQHLKGVLPKDYARPTLDKRLLGELIDLIGAIGLGDKESRSKDILGRVYEYFLGRFAEAEGKRGGQFYTPRGIVQLLVAMLEPYQGRIYDPCCGSGGMFVQSEEFVAAHGGGRFALSIFGQESNPTTWRLCKMNLAIRGIEGDLGPHNADSFLNDLHPDLKADYILANPPFNMKEWGAAQVQQDVRWKFGTPPQRNANYAWVQHMIHHLAPNGMAGFVLANGSMSSQSSGEGDIRQAIVEADLVDCMVALPGQLFYTTQIPVCLWFLARDKTGTDPRRPLRDRRGETLFIDARQMGQLTDRVHRELTPKDVRRIVDAYHAWRGETGAGDYADESGFCYSATRDEIRGHDYVLTPGRYVGIEEAEDDDEPFEEKLERLTAVLEAQFAESAKLEAAIRENLRGLGQN
ncbi:MAG TPA: class I SAM-dependent DNA methyltransferase [Anaerolineae bacterium]|nr:class I SAM-dependent DNA methyltransferase [Anaerolineae bacterium]HQH39126.1 class I SAM-dependent DNA methyltransferase [Anaerolineae bacterium]